MEIPPAQEIVIQSIEDFEKRRRLGRSLVACTLRGIDFRGREIDWQAWTLGETSFLGCQLSLSDEMVLRGKGAYLYRAPEELPYQPFRRDLYTWQELLDGFTPEKDNSVDLRIYRHFSTSRNHPPVNEALWQRIHDHAIDDGLRRLLDYDGDGLTGLKGVGIMGGHSVSRKDPFFECAARTARLLGQRGFFIVSGGGPGIMEAANFGAYFASYPDEAFAKALGILRKAVSYSDPAYYPTAFEVLRKFPDGARNLAIPTWFYGHEPTNVFASHIAKYFSNSIREDILLAISLYGIVFAPGSAGTTQEIFMDATQNHYGTFGYISPMAFLGKKRYAEDTMLFPLLQQLASGKPYGDMLLLTDSPEEVLQFLESHPPLKV